MSRRQSKKIKVILSLVSIIVLCLVGINIYDTQYSTQQLSLTDYIVILISITGIVILFILLIWFGGKLFRSIITLSKKITRQFFQTTILWLMGIGISVISFKVLTHWKYCKYPFHYLITSILPILIVGGLYLFTSKKSKEIKWLMWIAIIILLIMEFFLFVQPIPRNPTTAFKPYKPSPYKPTPYKPTPYKPTPYKPTPYKPYTFK